MKLLVICRPRSGVGRDEITRRARLELAALEQLRTEGVLLEAYSPGGPGAVLFFDADAATVTEALRALPLVNEGLVDTELIELHPLAGFRASESAW